MTEKTEQEKISMCIRYLEKRGYAVANPKMTTTQISMLLGVSAATIWAWTKFGNERFKPDFPKPLLNTGTAGKQLWSGREVVDWCEKHCETA